MTIGILTFHNVSNIGANLQAAALVQYVNREFGEAEIINYCPNHLTVYNSPSHRFLRHLRLLLTYPSNKQNLQKSRRIAAFQRENYRLSKQYYRGDADILAHPPQYDILISGSDQILNTTLSDCSTAYYLAFCQTAKKISYASSFGRTDISADEDRLIREELPKFSALSVREASAAEILTERIGCIPQLVLDPVFLLEPQEWQEKCSASSAQPHDYVFVYSMESSPVLVQLVQRVHAETGLPVVVVRGGGSADMIPGQEDPACGPKEFLRYIQDAALVVTNSFHGSALSVLFGKPFLCAAHSTRNTRLENLLTLAGQEASIVRSPEDSRPIHDITIDGQKAYIRLQPWIASSKAFLQGAIGGDSQ